jgi:hypothetical protein
VADLGTWVGVLVAVVAVAITWATYRSQRNRKQLEYLVLSTQRLVSPRVADDLDVFFDGRPVDDPSLTVLRMVSTGDKGIPADIFETPLTITLHGANAIVSASVSAVRPEGLPVKLTTDANQAHIEPLLLNAGDFIEIQALAAGQPFRVAVEARITDVVPKRRNSLPYPPGSGAEGQMLAMDKFMWSVPELLLAALLYFVISSADMSAVATVAWVVVAVTVVFFVIYPMQVKRLVRHRRNWRP